MNLPKTVLGAFVKQTGGVELRRVNTPELEDGSVLVEMKASGVCGTDLEKLTGQNITSSVLGHEVSGIVLESKSPNVQVGDRIVPHHHVSCRHCKLCLSGAETMCEVFKSSNFYPCGFAECFKVPSHNVDNGGVHKFSSAITFEEASFAEPLGCCLRGLSHVSGNDSNYWKTLRNVLVIGAGPIGLLHMEILKRKNKELKLVAVDVIKNRLEFAQKTEGANIFDPSAEGLVSEMARRETDSLGFDLIIVATGSLNAFAEAMRSMRKSGRLLLFGAPHKGSVFSLDLPTFFLNESMITSSYSATDREISEAIQMLEAGKIKVNKFITGKYPLSKIEEAMNDARSENHIKVIVTP